MFSGSRRVVALSVAFGGLWLAQAQDVAQEAWRLESRGQSAQAREQLRSEAQRFPNDVAIQRAYAE